MANPESGFSLTFKINDPKGIENMITMRSESNELPDISALLEDRDTLVEQLIANDWQPVSSGGSSRGSSNGDSGGRGSTYGGGNRNNRQSSYGNNNSGGGNAENCRCGVPGVRKSGQKNGRQWSAIMCKNRNCDPIFD